MKRRLGALCLAVLLSGCGGTDEPRPQAKAERDHCRAAEAGYRLCGQPGPWRSKAASTIQRRDDSGTWRVVAGPIGKLYMGEYHGYWRSLAVSPDGNTLLAQWSGECEIPHAFFVPAEGGRALPVTGESDWAQAPESIAHGWSADGRARVELLQGACGHGAERPGIYLIDPETGRKTFERPLERQSQQ